MPQEIERKFLVRLSKEIITSRPTKITTQWYLQTGPTEIRFVESYLPAEDRTVFKLGYKIGSGISREEVEQTLEYPIGLQLLKFVEENDTPYVQKSRWEIGGWEFDKYNYPSRLQIAEVELDNEDAELPPLPEGATLVEEVTNDYFYKNQALAMYGVP